MPDCEYEAEYNDLEDREKFKSWTCDETTDGLSPFCTFHDKTKVNWDNKTNARFRSKVQESMMRGTTLFCIGYHFPINISIKLLLRSDPNEPQINLTPSETLGT